MLLKIGDKAPYFETFDQEGNIIALAQFKGRKIVLFFYPKDNTPGCTAQACNLRDNYLLLSSRGYTVIGVSPDGKEKHKKFIDDYQFPFNLISDVDLKVHKLYDVWKKKRFFGKSYMGTIRTTFIIDEKGSISDIIKKVQTKNHTRQILK